MLALKSLPPKFHIWHLDPFNSSFSCLLFFFFFLCMGQLFLFLCMSHTFWLKIKTLNVLWWILDTNTLPHVLMLLLFACHLLIHLVNWLIWLYATYFPSVCCLWCPCQIFFKEFMLLPCAQSVFSSFDFASDNFWKGTILGMHIVSHTAKVTCDFIFKPVIPGVALVSKSSLLYN